jgi:hypothetical protein
MAVYACTGNNNSMRNDKIGRIAWPVGVVLGYASIELGNSNYFDSCTPLVVLDFCLGQIVTLLIAS